MGHVDLESRLLALQDAGGFSAELMGRFRDFVENADDHLLFRASPLTFACWAGVDEKIAIDLFLFATHAGVLDFNWGVLCPGCASFNTTAAALRSLAESQFCPMCQQDVQGVLDDNVEIVFTVHPAVRSIRYHRIQDLDLARFALDLFFSPSIDKNDEIHGFLWSNIIRSGWLAPGEGRALAIALPPGRYLLLGPSSHATLRFNVEAEGASGLDVEMLHARWISERNVLGAGDVTLHLSSRSPYPEAFVLLPDLVPPPHLRPPGLLPPAMRLAPRLTGQRLITSQAFSDLFRADSVPPVGGLDVRSLTVLFTDLTGSTALYERSGDLRAFSMVRQHFARLGRIVDDKGGAVVKTIGDAIMASFSHPRAGMDAALVMNQEIHHVAGGALKLKVGLHTGPCIAVDLNERLDYFGRTVNIAARVQALAASDEIVCTEDVFRTPGVPELLKGGAWRSCTTRESLKGIGDAWPVIRISTGA